MIKFQWKIKSVNHQEVDNVRTEFHLPETIAKVMVNRGLTNREIVREFFNPEIEKLHSPFLLKDMDIAVELILEKIKQNKSILVFGDYDVDGTTGTTVLFLFLKSIGADVQYYIPSREKEGYGLSVKGIDYAKLMGASLIITVDCGINAYEKVNYANSQNIDIIITDHHKADEKLPNAKAVINPNRLDCTYPFKGMCGASVAFKLGIALCEKGGYDSDLIWKHSDLVALGIAADIVPVNDENRAIVKHGLLQVQRGSNEGLKALMKTAGLWDKDATVGRLVFWLAPKINAAGRLGDAGRAVKLMTTDNPVFAHEMATELEKENIKRQSITENIIKEAIYQVNSECDLENENAIILWNEKWHHGVVGIVASRIKELYYRPTIIISMEKGESGSGSCRSISSFDIHSALGKCEEYLIGYGGHPIAAGLSIEKTNLIKFREKFLAVAKDTIDAKDLNPIINIDVDLKISDINSRFINFLKSMAPYGPKNMRPKFVSTAVKVLGYPKLIGKNSDVLKFKVVGNQSSFDAIAFGMAEHYEKLILNETIDIVYEIGENIWNGQSSIQLEIKDIKLTRDNEFTNS
jgi:single-stranded-DNA-specific exonuclease